MWIPCCERLPPIPKKQARVYLVTYESNTRKFVTYAAFTSIGWRFKKNGMNDAKKWRVIAWQELPKPY